MDGSSELTQLADLLRIGSHTARQIACLRPHDRAEIENLASQADAMADRVDALVAATSRRRPRDIALADRTH